MCVCAFCELQQVIANISELKNSDISTGHITVFTTTNTGEQILIARTVTSNSQLARNQQIIVDPVRLISGVHADLPFNNYCTYPRMRALVHLVAVFRLTMLHSKLVDSYT